MLYMELLSEQVRLTGPHRSPINLGNFHLPSLENRPYDSMQWPRKSPVEVNAFSRDSGTFFPSMQGTESNSRNLWSSPAGGNSSKNDGDAVDIPGLQQPTPPQLSRPGSRSLNNIMNDFEGEENNPDDDEPFQTSLHIAAERGHEDIVSMLLSSGAAVDDPDSEWNTALHRATRNQKLNVVLRLLKEGANPNAVNTAGWTPVHLAVSAGCIEIVRVLVQHGGDLSKKARGTAPYV
jgi:ankyrin repeat protein